MKGARMNNGRRANNANRTNGRCETTFVHEDRVNSARRALRDEGTILDLTETF